MHPWEKIFGHEKPKGPPPVTLALHNLNPRDAVEMVERKIQRALIAKQESLKIIHGDEKGKVRKAIHEYLENNKAVKSFEDDEERPGVTWVRLQFLNS